LAGENLIGGSFPAARNLISGNSGAGIQFIVVPTIHPGFPLSASRTIVQGNFIGTDISGTVALPNGGDGIDASHGSENAFGGLQPGAANLISGNAGNGISLGGEDTVQRNLIGTEIDGVKPLGNKGHGVVTAADQPAVIGAAAGGNADAGNTIAFNGGDGIAVLSSPTPSPDSSVSEHISANSIHDNGKLGIDIGANGVTAPPAQITSAFGFNGKLTAYGTVAKAAKTQYTLEFFANDTADSSGFGEGETFIGQANVMTDGSGTAPFNVTFPLPANASFLSATVTEPAIMDYPNGTTSEFAADAPISPTTPSPAPTRPMAVGLPRHSDQLLNISTRLQVGTADHVLIGGFIITGSKSKKVIVRGLGPSLSSANLSAVLADPVLELHDAAGQLIATNDDWKSGHQREVEATGIPPSSNLESAIVRTLTPGSYTVILRGKADGTGLGLVEVYDLSSGIASRLGNISTRGVVNSGDDVVIGGFIVGGSGGGQSRVAIRALGPSLGGLGVSDSLPDPWLELRDPNGYLLGGNDDWQLNDYADPQFELRAMGLNPADRRESAILLSLPAGNYTAIVRAKNNATGVALVEVYDVGY
jgi:hypothetical protein